MKITKLSVLSIALAALGLAGARFLIPCSSCNVALSPLVGTAVAQPASSDDAADSDFRQVKRPGAVDLDAEYDLANLRIPRDQIHTLLPRDAIPALTNPETEPASEADWLPADARIILVEHNDDVLGVPLRILDWHEVVNDTVGGEPVAITYCPLCDSATVFSRRVATEDGEPVTFEFGVSGALYNSNVLMYDKRDKALWSQLGMRAVSGPLAGASLDHLPVQLVSFESFRQRRPDAPIVSRDTGHDRDYSRSPYAGYMSTDAIMVPVAGVGDTLPRKTLGLGVAHGDEAWFIPIDLLDQPLTLRTPAGPLTARRTDAGIHVDQAPDDVHTAQTFYYAWSAFYPDTAVIHERPADNDDTRDADDGNANSPADP